MFIIIVYCSFLLTTLVCVFLSFWEFFIFHLCHSFICTFPIHSSSPFFIPSVSHFHSLYFQRECPLFGTTMLSIKPNSCLVGFCICNHLYKDSRKVDNIFQWNARQGTQAVNDLQHRICKYIIYLKENIYTIIVHEWVIK